MRRKGQHASTVGALHTSGEKVIWEPQRRERKDYIFRSNKINGRSNRKNKCSKLLENQQRLKTRFTFETVAPKDKDHIYHLLVNQPKSVTNHEIQTRKLLRQVDNPPSKLFENKACPKYSWTPAIKTTLNQEEGTKI